MPVEVEIVRSVEVPTRLVHGPGALARLGETLRELGVTRPLLVTDPGVAAAGLADLALEHLDDAVVFDEVRPNPDIALVDEGARSYVDSQCDGLVGLGGGSSMDTAKSIGSSHGTVARSPTTNGATLRSASAFPAGRDPDHGGHRERGDAVGRDHRPRAQDQIQRRRNPADRSTRRTHRSRAHARASATVTAATGMDAPRTRSSASRATTTSPSTTRSLCKRSSSWPRGSDAVADGSTSRRARRWHMRRCSAGWRTGRRAPVPLMR